MELILASTSPYRRMLLERLDVPFRCVAPEVDEEALKAEELSLRALAERLAEAKAMSLVAECPGATLVGSDQVVAFQGRIYGKPGTVKQAVETLLAMSGQTHELITAVAVYHGGQIWHHTDVTRLHMRRLARNELERYVAADQPLDCAGAYKLESRGIVLFDRIESEDQTAITGLPLIALMTHLRELGYPIP